MNQGIAFQVTVAATSAQMPSNPVKNFVTLYAKAGNTGSVYIGFSSAVTTSTGFELAKGTSVRVNLPGGNTNQMWSIGTASDGFSVIGT